MKCPVCKDVTLLMSEKNGIEIDYCPECRGIWLDRGELEKIMERSEKDTYHGDKNAKPYKKKKTAMLSEIFELFGGEE